MQNSVPSTWHLESPLDVQLLHWVASSSDESAQWVYPSQSADLEMHADPSGQANWSIEQCTIPLQEEGIISVTNGSNVVRNICTTLFAFAPVIPLPKSSKLGWGARTGNPLHKQLDALREKCKEDEGQNKNQNFQCHCHHYGFPLILFRWVTRLVEFYIFRQKLSGNWDNFEE